MAETTPPPGGPLAGASGRELRELQQFLLYLGSALTAAGEAVNHVELHLGRVAAAYGAPRARVSVLPTYLVVALEPGGPATLEPTRQLRGVLRLDQTAALFGVLKAAEDGVLAPEGGAVGSGRSWPCGRDLGPGSRSWVMWC
jgi:Putative threonine/serine exporter